MKARNRHSASNSSWPSLPLPSSSGKLLFAIGYFFATCVEPHFDDLSVQIEEEGAEMAMDQLGANDWQLESAGVVRLLNKLRHIGKPLGELAGVKAYRGILTGFNEAFLIDDACKRQLVEEHAGCREVIKPFLRGSDIGRWGSDWDALFLLAVLNSPLMWWHNWRYLPHMKDEALSPVAFKMENLPIAEPTAAIREAAETVVRRLIEITAARQQTQRSVLDWLRVEYAIAKPSNRLQVLTDLDSDGFVAEVKRIRGRKLPLTAAGLQALREEFSRSIEPARTLAAEALKLECSLSDLVNQAYGLTAEEIALMWETAPPRMPIAGPLKSSARVRCKSHYTR